jgi:hypothetical protein
VPSPTHIFVLFGWVTCYLILLGSWKKKEKLGPHKVGKNCSIPLGLYDQLSAVLNFAFSFAYHLSGPAASSRSQAGVQTSPYITQHQVFVPQNASPKKIEPPYRPTPTHSPVCPAIKYICSPLICSHPELLEQTNP